jgi:serine/threonine-protein kinase
MGVPVPVQQPHGVFVSYRRTDAAFAAGWLYEQLVNRFGSSQVFKDLDSIELGEEFATVITGAVQSCHTLLAVIGPKWLSASDDQAGRRLDRPEDFVRLEIETALRHSIHIIPVLVLDAEMPKREELPPSIAALAGRNAIEITGTHFQADAERLLRSIDRIARQASADTRSNPPSQVRPTSPRLLADKYELGPVLGYGGMSEVRRGWDTRLGREVAVKSLRADLARDPQLQARFRREAQNAAALNHPAIVAVYDTGDFPNEAGPLPFVVMEHVDGQTLREIIHNGGPLPERRAVEVATEVCAALEFSHRNGIGHGAVQPANIMVSRTGEVKVKDFGVARPTGSTMPGGDVVDARRDIHGVGGLLFEMLTGKCPSSRTTQAPSQIHPGVSAALDTVVRTALTANPAQGYRSAAEMGAALMRIGAGPHTMTPAPFPTATLPPAAFPPRPPTESIHRPVMTPPPGRASRPPRPSGKVVGITLAVLIVLGLAGGTAYRFAGLPATTRQIAVPTLSGLTVLDAGARLDAAGLRVGSVRRVPSEVGSVDRVTASDPGAGFQVDADTAVDLSVGGGPDQVPAPDQVAVPLLLGLTPDEAAAQLGQLGLTVGARSTSSGPANRVGKIIACNPTPGTLVDGGSAVDIVVGVASTGDPDPNIPVPDVVDRPANDAQQTLEVAGFRVDRREVDDAREAGTVAGTDPEPGTRVRKGSTVTLQVSKGSDGQGSTVQVPNVVGQSTAEAEQLLTTAGLVMTVSTQQVLNPAFDGKVIGQSPPGGETITAGESVQLVVGEAAGEPPN